MHTAHNSTLLPELFRHKTTKVRLFQPQVILLDFHGTISERRWEDKIIFPYVKQAVNQYLKTNWYNDTVQHCFFGLRDESFNQRFRNRYDDAPVISDITKDGSEMDPDQLIAQVSDFLVWQMDSKKLTKDTQVIERLVWRDGLKRQQIKVPIYEDVLPCIQAWRTVNKCRIFIASSIDEDTLKLLFSNTDRGDLTPQIDGYVCPSKASEKRSEDFYKRFYQEVTKFDSHKVEKETVQKSKAKSPDPKQSVVTASRSQGASSSMTEGVKLDKQKSTSSETLCQPKPILFLTDSGQEAKAASQVADGQAYECLLVNRPGNRQIRTYYLSLFSYIEKFSDIQFAK